MARKNTGGVAEAAPPSNGVHELDETPVTVDRLTKEEPPKIIGASGRVYKGTNLLTELTTRQKNAARACLGPCLPIFGYMLGKAVEQLRGGEGEVSPQEVGDLLRSLDLTEVFNALVMEDLDVKLMAILYLPEEARCFSSGTPEEIAAVIEERSNDFLDLTYAEKWQGFKDFFTWNSQFCLSAVQGFMVAMQKMTTTTTLAQRK